jgi:hypothetical protein
MDVVRRLTRAEQVSLMGVVREISESSRDEQVITSQDIEPLLLRAPDPFDVSAKARKLLNAISRKSTYAGFRVEMQDADDFPLAYAQPSSGDEEFRYLVRYLADAKWIEFNAHLQGLGATVTPLGWEELRRKPRQESDKAFVAMWFNRDLDDAFTKGIAAAVLEDCGFRAVRIDLEQHNDDIVDRVIAEINESRFLVADLTGHRAGVYFEAGYAKGIGIPVIWTCRRDDAKNTHFDAEHFNQIRWTDSADLRSQLQVRIRATIGRGPVPTVDERQN